ncbi:hypothetical protein B5F39_13775 [Cloacibacillus sp. An23]|nr:hypothetical protein B5F39_13775 [Cloacibacillus sp. An23]
MQSKAIKAGKSCAEADFRHFGGKLARAAEAHGLLWRGARSHGIANALRAARAEKLCAHLSAEAVYERPFK